MDPVTLGLCSQIDLDFEVQARLARPRAAGAGRRHAAAGRAHRAAAAGGAEEPKDEDAELDADAVFAKLSSLKSKTPDEEDEE